MTLEEQLKICESAPEKVMALWASGDGYDETSAIHSLEFYRIARTKYPEALRLIQAIKGKLDTYQEDEIYDLITKFEEGTER